MALWGNTKKKYNVFDEATKDWCFKAKFYYKICLIGTKIRLIISNLLN